MRTCYSCPSSQNLGPCLSLPFVVVAFAVAAASRYSLIAFLAHLVRQENNGAPTKVSSWLPRCLLLTVSNIMSLSMPIRSIRSFLRRPECVAIRLELGDSSNGDGANEAARRWCDL